MEPSEEIIRAMIQAFMSQRHDWLSAPWAALVADRIIRARSVEYFAWRAAAEAAIREGL